MTSADFDFHTEHLPSNVRDAGPVLDDPSWSAPSDAWEPPWSSDVEGPIVLVALSSAFQDQGPVVRRIVAALSTLRVRGLVTLGEQLDHEQRRAARPHSIAPASSMRRGEERVGLVVRGSLTVVHAPVEGDVDAEGLEPQGGESTLPPRRR